MTGLNGFGIIIYTERFQDKYVNKDIIKLMESNILERGLAYCIGLFNELEGETFDSFCWLLKFSENLIYVRCTVHSPTVQ